MRQRAERNGGEDLKADAYIDFFKKNMASHVFGNCFSFLTCKSWLALLYQFSLVDSGGRVKIVSYILVCHLFLMTEVGTV